MAFAIRYKQSRGPYKIGRHRWVTSGRLAQRIANSGPTPATSPTLIAIRGKRSGDGFSVTGNNQDRIGGQKNFAIVSFCVSQPCIAAVATVADAFRKDWRTFSLTRNT